MSNLPFVGHKIEKKFINQLGVLDFSLNKSIINILIISIRNRYISLKIDNLSDRFHKGTIFMQSNTRTIIYNKITRFVFYFFHRI